MRGKWAFIFVGFYCSFLFAQDPVYTQFYAAPTLLNPAFSGSSGNTRVSVGYRNQWFNLSQNLSTRYVSTDSWFEGINSGIGFNLVNQREESSGYNFTVVNLSYSYHLQIANDLTFFPGIEFGYGFRNIDLSEFILGDQLDVVSGAIFPESSDALLTELNEGVQYANISAGGVLFADKYWVGFAIRHLNQPNVSFLDEGEVPLELFYTLHGGYKITLSESRFYGEPSLSTIFLTFNYIKQNQYNRFDLGGEMKLNKFSLGVLVSNTLDPLVSESDYLLSINPLVGFQTKKFKIGFSYDFPISEIGSLGSTAEISLQFFFPKNYTRKRVWQSKY